MHVSDPLPGPAWEGITYRFYIDENNNAQLDSGETTRDFMIPVGSMRQMDVVPNVRVSGTYWPVVTWDAVPEADYYRVRIYPVVNGVPSTVSRLFQIGQIPEDGSGSYMFMYTGDLFLNNETLAIAIEAREHLPTGEMINRSRYYVQHSPIAPAITGGVPDTQQVGDYTTTYGEDADFAINPQSFNKLDHNGKDLPDSADSWIMVRDNVTGLIWEVKQARDGSPDELNPHDADNLYTWYDDNPETNGGFDGTPGIGTDTKSFIQELNGSYFGGHADWRMPTTQELAAIINWDAIDPSTDQFYFPSTSSSAHWTATTNVASIDRAWQVSFNSGGVLGNSLKSNSLNVRAVRGGKSTATDPLFINADNTVTDTSKGLLWERKTDDGSLNDRDNLYTWEGALAWVATLNSANYLGFNDWRLPNINELRSIVNYDRSSPAVDTIAFPNMLLSHYWSSTTYFDDTSSAWCLNFTTGVDDTVNKGSTHYVRAIRGGQNRQLDHLVILRPSQGSDWIPESRMIITWETQDIPGNVEITLSREGGKNGIFETITASTENDGLFLWTVTAGVSSNCVIKVKPLSDGHEDKETVQGLFTIEPRVTGRRPDTGQVQCFDNGAEMVCPQTGDPFYGQDANYNINPQSYTKLDANGNALPDAAVDWTMVRDNITGLMWENKQARDEWTDYANPNDADNTYTWYNSNPDSNGGDVGTPGNGTDTEDIIQALNDANFGGYSDWRLPTIKELASIVYANAHNPSINERYFPTNESTFWEEIPAPYWSSTTDADSSFANTAWYVDFNNGNVIGRYPKDNNYHVRAVRGGQASQERLFYANGNGTVTDGSTGLMWELKTDDDGPNDKDRRYSWEAALAWVADLNASGYLGYNDWRLPNTMELQSLVHYRQLSPVIDVGFFPNTMFSQPYWSSTTFTDPSQRDYKFHRHQYPHQ